MLTQLIAENDFNAKKPVEALLVSVYKGSSDQKQICEEHLQELARLSETYGLKVLGTVPCAIRKYEASTFVTEGKLEELVEKAKECYAELIIFDDEISPSQQRNLEKAFQIPVIDRTELILAVFAQRAQTKEARLQIELAQAKYQGPRLKRMWTHLSRQHGSGGSGGGAYLKGEGEKQIEIDRRLLKKKITQLQKELLEVQSHRETQRLSRQRTDIPLFALIGYTNVGKSTLLNALTDAGVFVEDKLFATLDTTTRKFTLPNNQEVLIIDTVGFIRKLPHLLVTAFRSTLEEAMQADILLHLIDASHPMAEEQAATTFELLKELNSENKPIITVLNKIDQCNDPSLSTRLRLRYSKLVEISALKKTGFAELQQKMIEELSQQRKVMKLCIPQAEYKIVSELMKYGHVLQQEYVENNVLLKVDLPHALGQKLKKYESMT